MKNFSFLFLFICFLPLSVSSEELYKTKKVSSYVMSSPGGPRIGEIYHNAKLLSLEKKGKWSKLSVEVWLENDELVGLNSPAANTKTNSVLTSTNKGKSSIEVTSYSIKRTTPFKSDAIKLKKAIISIDLKNLSEKEIKELNGFLVVRDKNQKLVLRTPVSSKKAVSPGATFNLKFAWTEEEEEYHSLLSYPKPNQAFEVSIAGVN